MSTPDSLTPAELAEALEARTKYCIAIRSIGDTALDRAAAAKLREMERALKPFALRGGIEFTVGDYDNPTPAPDKQIFGAEVQLTVGDLRAARSALKENANG